MASARKRFVLCIKNRGFEVSLDPRKLYQVLPDNDAAKHQQLRVIDESGEDYLYPESYFREIGLPQSIQKAVLAAA